MRRIAVFLAVPLLACATDARTLTDAMVRTATPAFVARDAGDAQLGVVGLSVAIPPRVRVLDIDGHPLADVPITCTPGLGSGDVLWAQTRTDSNGKADCGAWTLGQAAGVQTLSVWVSGTQLAPATFTARARSTSPARLVLVSGDLQVATMSTPIAHAPVVQVFDVYNNAVAGVTVTFTPSTGSGTVTAGTVLTDITGTAAPGLWTLGENPGAQQLIVSVAGTVPMAVRATALSKPAQAATHVVLLGGDAQTASVGAAVSTDPTVQVLDENDMPVKGVLVSFSLKNGIGSVSVATALTDASGLASTHWTLGTSPGTQALDITIVTGSTLTLHLQAAAVVGAPALVLPVLGDGQMATVKSVLPDHPTVRVLDAYNNAVAGVTVIFAVRTGGSTIASGIALTDTNGYASAGDWKLGADPGETKMDVLVGALGALTFKATGTP
jgi:adhesin/invasin